MNTLGNFWEKARAETDERTRSSKQQQISVGIEQNENQGKIDKAARELEAAKAKGDPSLIAVIEEHLAELYAEKKALEEKLDGLVKEEKSAGNRHEMN